MMAWLGLVYPYPPVERRLGRLLDEAGKTMRTRECAYKRI